MRQLRSGVFLRFTVDSDLDVDVGLCVDPESVSFQGVIVEPESKRSRRTIVSELEPVQMVVEDPESVSFLGVSVNSESVSFEIRAKVDSESVSLRRAISGASNAGLGLCVHSESEPFQTRVTVDPESELFCKMPGGSDSYLGLWLPVDPE